MTVSAENVVLSSVGFPVRERYLHSLLKVNERGCNQFESAEWSHHEEIIYLFIKCLYSEVYAFLWHKGFYSSVINQSNYPIHRQPLRVVPQRNDFPEPVVCIQFNSIGLAGIFSLQSAV